MVLFSSFGDREVLLIFLVIFFTNLMVRGKKLMNSSVNVEYQMSRFEFRNSQHTFSFIFYIFVVFKFA